MFFSRPVWGSFQMRAYLILPFWFGWQLLSMLFLEHYGQVAHSAHVGGFAFGALAALAMKALGLDRRLAAASEEKATLFTAHPLYLQASTALANKDRERAQSTYEQLLAENPQHVEGAVDLFYLNLEGTDGAAVAASANQAVANCKRAGQLPLIRQIAVQMRERFPQVDFADRNLLNVALSYVDEDRATAQQYYQRIHELYPDSPLAPKALLEAARLERKRLGDTSEGNRLFAKLIAAYPGSPYAVQAEKELQGR